MPGENHILPQLKLERLANELNQLEEELRDLEKDDVPSAFGDENECKSHLKEIEIMRDEMQNILNSEAFESLDGRTKLQGMLDEGN